MKTFTIVTAISVCILYNPAKLTEENKALVDTKCEKADTCCSENAVDSKCTSCKPGYFGGRCKNICPNRCPTCTDHPNASKDTNGRGYCTECIAGYFSTHDLYQCQTACPDVCKTCVSFVSPLINCDSCTTGYHLVLQSGSAGKCIACPDNCKECISDSSCSECNVGYYGPACTIPCSSGCKHALCSKENGICIEGCKTDVFIPGGKCNVCIDGRYGSDCIHVCSRNCQSTCDKNTGYCSECINNFIGDMCENCTDGFYGEHCNILCFVNCRDNNCHQTTGFCVSCNDGFDGNNCSVCVPGKFGNNCDKTCPIKCEGKTCNRSSGECIACVGHFTGFKCDRCTDGYFLNDVTNDITAESTCTECIKTCKYCHSLEKCIQCVTGYFGEDCQQSCSVGCKNNTCEHKTGICSYNCSADFIGSKCNECSQGRYGMNCSLPCPEHCIFCDRSSGHCTVCNGNFSGPHCEDCIFGMYGTYCNQNCPEHCNHSQCDRYSAHCSFGCMKFFSGPMCEECVEGKYGHHCNEPCPENCLESTCVRSTGHCFNCSGNFEGSKCGNCINGLYGDNCTHNCSGNCVGRHCDSLDQIRGSMCTNYVGNLIQDDENEVDGGSVAGGVVVTLLLLAVFVTLAVILRRRFISGKLLPWMDISCLQKNERIYENESTLDENTYRRSEKLQPSMGGFDSVVQVKEKTSTEFNRNGLTANCCPNDELCEQPVNVQVKKEMFTKRVHFEKKHVYENNGDVIDEGPSYSNAVVSSKVRVENLSKYVAGKSEKAFISEFQKLPKGLQKQCTEARKPDNIIKNRYNSVYPYDDTRVILEGPGSDYINACYINGYNKEKEYIASLGPTLKAMEKFVTFWRMVWQEKTEKIVMVTNLKERGGMKCEKYWPDVGCTARYGDVSVTCLSEDIYAEYTVRNFMASKESIRRTIHHIHFTAWPDKGVPDDVTSLIDFRQRVKSVQTVDNGRTIVHCSAGVGRTGTFIALDLLIQQGENDQTVDVFECVCNLRQQRTTMVQTWEQYQYLHQALVHSLIYGSEAISAEEFNEFLSSSSKFQMAAKFEQLQGIKEALSKDERDAIYRHSCLQDVNRDGADVPGNKHRVYLYTGRLSGDSEYINATFLNSFRIRDKYIVAQTPLPGTVGDFLTMTLQENASCIVSMDAEQSDNLYLPIGDDLQMIAGFETRSAVVTSNRSFTHRKLCVTMNSGEDSITREVNHFQCNHWADDNLVPENPELFLQLIHATEQADDRHDSRPVIVHCLNAAERSGLFCAVSVLLQKMDCVREVSVVNTLRQVKVRRPLAIPNKEQYIFCYTCVSEHLRTDDSNAYYNFA